MSDTDGRQTSANTAGRQSRRPTIRDVAAAAGVSKSLVSLAFSDPDRVSEERRRRVFAAADRLGFRPNLTARSLSKADGDFTGILVADLHNPVFTEILDAARFELSRSGRTTLLTSAMIPGEGGRPTLDRLALAVFGDLRPRSVLIVGSVPDMSELSSIAPRTPIVIASAVADHLPVAATVRTDDTAGMRLVVDHLVDAGHRRIAHVGGQGGIVAERRVAAYAEAMAAHGLSAEIRVHPADYSEIAGYAAGAALLDSSAPPSAITAVNDLAAVGVLAATTERGSTVAVTGYDNSFVSGLRQVSLTTVDPHNATIGKEAALRILDIEDGRAIEIDEALVPPSLVVRASSQIDPA